MKRLFLILALTYAFSSCSDRNDSNTRSSEASITYELDTVMVDAGEEFIYVNWLLTSSGESQDEKFLYNFNRDALTLQVIDLDQLKLIKTIQHQKEGPDGLGFGMISKIYDPGDGTLIYSDNYLITRFDKEGNKLNGFRYADHSFVGEKLPDDKRILLNETISKDGNTLIALYGSKSVLDSTPDGLAIFDLENKTVEYKPLDIFKKLEKYQTVFYYNGEQPISAFGASIFLTYQNDSLIYTNTAENKAHFYNLKPDSLTSLSYVSRYTKPEVEVNYPKRTETEEEFKEVRKLTDKIVQYYQFLYDDKNQVYWRFSKDFDHMQGDQAIYKTVLTAFNPRFEQLGEVLLQDDFVLPYKIFVKNGMIYSFLNMEDEVAFVRLKPTISHE
ncbi:DUF4221 family protein [Algoriphagus halophilus]|uniref:DUF4221 domain-containing protein n=1 Tax=Algoriphagus halophilus TaxID=226505 RepID=A0A1N6GF46_9BACT|nr:DUF4221 family protein [Algoriphagus halophilus]SIO06143.1 protein of unknown function [Algoriphagus halophilus]